MESLARALHPRGEDLSAYTDHALGASTRAAVERHLDTCARCAATALAYGRISRSLRELPEVPAPATLGEVLRRVRFGPQHRRPRHTGMLGLIIRNLWSASVSAAS
ncbi:MAG: hypothetical protein AVDCRST_MAG77-4412 [uncultured Chloroflexi bacterium]|uniref:Putative zinc-finger domain-containing protein n=1 Tax=uncultured Chloroflexota bacterium TaxID=166587 RepID=A0A6J4JTX9_9CHLR|nr:MAG: hypothetical protein AVDCRST_MAG77-4412 [uncultured Chloroflexota bacterium]